MSPADEKIAQQSIDGATIGDSQLSTIPKTALAQPTKGVDIEGFEGIPASMVAVPFCRMIQPTSKRTELADGSEAPQGSFLFNDVQEYVEELNFVLLRAKHEMKAIDENGQFVFGDYEGETFRKPVVSILGITTENCKIPGKLFILSLSTTSFTAFGKLIAKFKGSKIDKSYRFELTAKTIKTENKKGKFYVLDISIGAEVTPENLATIAKLAADYGVVLDREIYQDQEAI